MNAIFFNYNDFSDILQNSGNFVALFLVGFVLLDADRSRLKLISVFGGEYVQMKKFCAFGWGLYSKQFSWSLINKINNS
jgi:hypothetical protein